MPDNKPIPADVMEMARSVLPTTYSCGCDLCEVAEQELLQHIAKALQDAEERGCLKGLEEAAGSRCPYCRQSITYVYETTRHALKNGNEGLCQSVPIRLMIEALKAGKKVTG